MRFEAIQSILNRLYVLLLPDGQNATEYALTIAMVALGTVAGMESLASGINHTFTTVTVTLANHLH